MTEDEKDKVICDFLNKLANAAEKASSAWELRCQATAAKEEVLRKAGEKLLDLAESFGPMAARATVTKMGEESEDPPS